MMEARKRTHPWFMTAAAWLCAMMMLAAPILPAGAEDAWMEEVAVEEGIALTREEAAAAAYDAFEAEEDRAFFMGKVTDLRQVFDIGDRSWEGLAAFTWEIGVPDAREITLHFGAVQLTGTADKIVLEDLRGRRTAYTGSELDHKAVTMAGEALSVTLYLTQNSPFTAALEAVYSNNHPSLHVEADPGEKEGSVSLTLRQVTGRPIRQVTYTLRDEGGTVVEQTSSTALTYEKAHLPAGQYTVSAQVTDGTHTAEIGGRAVAARDPAARAVFSLQCLSHVPDARTGESVQVAFQAGSPANGTVQFYVFRLIDPTGRVVSEYASGSPTYAIPLPADGVYAVLCAAYDGVNFAVAYTNWFQSSTPAPLSISLQVNGAYNSGSSVTIRPTALTGGPVRHMTVILLNSQYQHVQRWDFAGSQGEVTLPSVTGPFAFWVFASNTVTNASAGSNWFTISAAKVEQEVTQLTFPAQTGRPVSFQITTTQGIPLWSAIKVRKPDSTIVASTVVADANHIYSWTPEEPGQYVLEVAAYDGVQFEGNWLAFNVAARPVYRALVIGMGYTNEGSNALPGTLQDADTVELALGTVTPGYDRITKLHQPTRAQIERGILNAFAGATANDVSLIYYSGHGTESGALVTTDQNYAARYIYPRTFRQWLDRIPGTKIVLVDACHSGKIINKSTRSASYESSFASSFTAAFRTRTRSLDAPGYYVITAAHSSQLSYEGTIYSNGTSQSVGIFTHFLLKGIGYDNVARRQVAKFANTNQDSGVTMMEAYTYAREQAYQRTQSLPTQYGPDNQPIQWGQVAQYYFTDPAFVFVDDVR